jgi:hypothetical protein
MATDARDRPFVVGVIAVGLKLGSTIRASDCYHVLARETHRLKVL